MFQQPIRLFLYLNTVIDGRMHSNHIKIFILMFVAVFIAIGCTSSPYIYKPNEFNRTLPDFSKIPKDRKSIKICYSELASKLIEVQNLAQKECGLYGKLARFQEYDFLHCPLMTPTGATFNCFRP